MLLPPLAAMPPKGVFKDCFTAPPAPSLPPRIPSRHAPPLPPVRTPHFARHAAFRPLAASAPPAARLPPPDFNILLTRAVLTIIRLKKNARCVIIISV